MAPHRFPANGVTHPLERSRFSLGPKATGHLFKTGLGESGDRTEQNSLAGLFDREFGARPPSPGIAYALGQYDLALGRKPRGLHW
jgi:hypothetical protein